MALPRGFKYERVSKKHALRWINSRDGTAQAMIFVGKDMAKKWYQGKAFNAAKKTRLAHKPEKKKKKRWYSKVYKKTLSNGLKYYFFTYYEKRSRGPNREVRGFINIGDALYRVDGRISKKEYGLSSLYWILGTIKPVKTPKKRKRAFRSGDKPAIIRDREEKDQGVPLY